MPNPKITNETNSHHSNNAGYRERTTTNTYHILGGSSSSTSRSDYNDGRNLDVSNRVYKVSYSSHFGRTKIDGHKFLKTNPFSERRVKLSSTPGSNTTTKKWRWLYKVKSGPNRNRLPYIPNWTQERVDETSRLFSIQDFDPRGYQNIGPAFPGYYRAAKSVNSKIGSIDVNAALAFAERRKTFSLVKDNASRVVDAMDHIRYNNDLKGAATALGADFDGSRHSRFTRGFGPKWLELIYGWKPLLSDIHGALTAPHALSIPEFWVKSTVLTKQHIEEYDRSIDLDYRVTFKTLVRVTNPVEYSAQRLGLTNPLLIAWELVPYSFVVDWFLPVGGYLESLDSRLGLELDESSSTYSVKESQEIKLPANAGGTPESFNIDYGSREYSYSSSSNGLPAEGSASHIWKERVLSFPEYPLPQLENPFSLSHAITAVALVESRRSAFR